MNVVELREIVDDIAARWSDCEHCALHSARKSVVVGEYGEFTDSEVGPEPDAPLVMVVGEAPGRHEDVQGRPMIGPAGSVVREILAAAGVRRSLVTNTVACRPAHNRDPLPVEIEACRPRLSALVAMLRPALLVTVGRIAREHVVSLDWKGEDGLAGVPTVTMVQPASWMHRQLPSAVVERKKKESIKEIAKALLAVTPKVVTDDDVEPECECVPVVVGRWVDRAGITVMPLSACNRCGKIV